MKYLSLLWLAVLLPISAGKEKRGRYVPVEETPPDDKDHRALQSNNNRVTGVAYECNDNNFEMPQGSQVRNFAPGDVIKVCIKPEQRTANRGIVMRSVDSMNFIGGGSGISQKVIEFQKEAFTTLAICIPGQLVCSFRTKLQEELFWGLEGGEVNITGVALVTMEYIDQSYALYGLADTDVPVELQFLVRRIAAPPGVIIGGPKAGKEDQKCNPKWWCNYPLWFKIFLIILAFVILCCCCALCVTCPCMVREMFQDDREREERRIFVKQQKMRADRGSFQDYPEEDYFENSYRSSSFRQQPPPPPPPSSQGSYRQPPPPPPPPQPARQSSYRVPRAESSSFRAQQRPSQPMQYDMAY